MKYFFVSKQGQLKSIYQIILGIFCYVSAEKISNFTSLLLGYTAIPEESQVLLKFIVVFVQLILLYFLYKWLFTYGYETKFQYLGDIDCFKPSKKSFMYLCVGILIALISFSLALLPLYISEKAFLLPNTFYPDQQIIIFLSYLPVAFGEELLFRGALQHALLRTNKWLAVLLLGVIFGYMHVNYDSFYFSSLCMAGICMGVIMYATNSIQATIGFHFAWDWVQSSFYGVSTGDTDFTLGIFRTRFSSEDFIAPVQATIETLNRLITIVLLILTFIFLIYGFLKKRYFVYTKDGYIYKRSHGEVKSFFNN